MHKTFDTNAITIGRSGSKINGDASVSLTIEKVKGITLVYVDGTVGWKTEQKMNLHDRWFKPAYVAATVELLLVVEILKFIHLQDQELSQFHK